MSLKRTPLFTLHQQLGAKFVPFAGWEMPIQYRGVIEEHNCVRHSVGIFDVSHMGEIFVRGPKALGFLQYTTSNDVSLLAVGRAQYSFLLNEEGGVIDDIIVYRLDENEYLLCVNASNAEKDYEWLEKHLEGREHVALENASSWYGQIALQGPEAEELMGKLSPETTRLKPFSCEYREFPFLESACIVARTGYTGEDGFEVFCPSDQLEVLWTHIMELSPIQAIGLGARDTLRLEASLPLHGHELREDLPAWTAGFDFAIKIDKGDFVGGEALRRLTDVTHRLTCLEVLSPGIVREGAKLFYPNGQECGWVSSGTKPPTVGKAIALAFLPASALGDEFEAEVRGRRLKVRVVDRPFYKRKKV